VARSSLPREGLFVASLSNARLQVNEETQELLSLLIEQGLPATLAYTREARCPAITIMPTRRTWELLYLLTLRDLKLRYQDTVFGLLWSLMKPLALGAVLYVALSVFVRVDVEDYQLVLLTALFPWVWFQSSALLATGSFAGNGALLKKVPFPRFVLPFSTILNSGFHFFLSIPVLIIVLLLSDRHPDATWIVGVPVLAAVQLALLMGLVLLAASMDVYFRDLEHLVEVFLSLLFYVTPILYPLSIVPDEWQPVLKINPLTSLIEAWRDLFMNNQLPGLDLWPALLFTGGALAVGIWVFRKLEPGFADAL
jgi:ABC-type polysaccharide/polyol phosphate export permease